MSVASEHTNLKAKLKRQSSLWCHRALRLNNTTPPPPLRGLVLETTAQHHTDKWGCSSSSSSRVVSALVANAEGPWVQNGNFK